MTFTRPILLMLLLSGCVVVPKGNKVALSDSLNYTLTAPPAILVNSTESHLIETTFEQQSHSFISQIEYKEDEIALAAISIQGLPLFDFVWTSREAVQINQYVPLPFIDINNIIADIQLCYWPIEQIAASIGDKNGSAIQQQSPDDTIIWRRIIRDENKPVIIIERTNKGFQLDHLQRNYRINITVLKQDEI